MRLDVSLSAAVNTRQLLELKLRWPTQRRDRDKHDRRSLRQRKLGKGQAQTSCRWPLGLTFLPTLLATADAVVDKSFAALHMSARGTKRTYRYACYLSAFGGKADMSLTIAIYQNPALGAFFTS